MSFPRYPTYKASGVEWLGEVPAGWTINRLRFMADLNPSKQEIAGLSRDTLVTFLPMEAIGDDGTLDVSRERPVGDVDTGYTFVKDGDVAIAKITPCYENGKGALMAGLANGLGFGTTELIVARPKPDLLDAKYLHYLFISREFRDIGESYMYGAGGQKRVPDDFVRDFATAFPKFGEQKTIASFLDRETAKIDALVAEQQRLMELLKEKRQAVISHAVTKGLNPDAPMKPSGVEWLGDVPAHWTLAPLKFLVDPDNGIQMGPFGGMLLGLSSADTGYKVFGQQNTISGDFTLGGRWIEEGRYFALSNYWLKTGDIALTRKGSLGNARLIGALPSPGIIDSDTIRIRTDQSRIRREYLAVLFHEAFYVLHQITQTKRGAILAGVNSGTIANIMIAQPPVSEQRQLLEWLAQQEADFEALHSTAERAIALLMERRSALISAAVTGQIDVRHLAPEAA